MTCNFCGSALPPTALFCGECGRSLGLGSRPFATNAELTVDLLVDPQAQIAPEPEALPMQAAPLEPELSLPEAVPDPEPFPEASLPQASLTATSLPATLLPVTSLPVTDTWLPSRLLPPIRPRPEPTESDVEATRIVPSGRSALRFVLQFSTGESVTVFGNGLVGRNPVAEPSEYFDHLVAIVDPGRSVSKTHLEFGQAVGAFWVSDRYSGNGTVVREPDGAPLRCESGKRYRIVRGTRVIMGDQFFVVS